LVEAQEALITAQEKASFWQRAQEESASALATTQHQLDTNNQEWAEKLARMTAQVGNSGLIVTVLQ